VRLSEAADRPRLVFLLGATRSGSTVLNAILGAHPSVVAVGELFHLLRLDHGDPRVCACGKEVGACELWGRVLDGWRKRQPDLDTAAYLLAQDRFERYRRLLGILGQARRPSAEFSRYARWTAALIEATAEISGRSVVADSSKHPPRALALILSGAARPVLIHVVRDPRGVAWSKVKYLRRPWGHPWLNRPLPLAARTALDWVGINLFAEHLMRLDGIRSLRVRYEDLVDDPRTELSRIGKVTGLDLSRLAADLAAGTTLVYGHIVAGNRARFRPGRQLAKDLDWSASSPRWMRVLVWSVTAPVARRYGYRW